MKDITDVRKAIKPLGFRLTSRAYSYGRHVTYTDLTGKPMPSIFSSQDDLAKWRPLINWKKEHETELKEIRANTGVYGLWA